MKRIVFILIFAIVLFIYPMTSLASYEISISVQPEDGGTVTGAGTYEDGQNATLTATPAAGYSFEGWYNANDMESPASTEAEFEYDLEADRNYVAVFTRKYAVNTDSIPADGGSTTGAGQYATGEEVSITAQPAPGYVFEGWFQSDSTDAISTDPTYTFTIGEEDVQFTAKFSINYTLSIEIDPAEGGTATGAGEAAGGTVVKVEAIPNDDYRFVGWFDSTAPSLALSTEKEWSFNLDSNKTLIARFDRSYGYIFSRLLITIGICVGVAFAAYVLIKRNMIIKRRNIRRYRRPSDGSDRR